jgi:GTP-binding protein
MVALDAWPEGGVPEIGFAGRSNVGKSTLINALTGVTGWARRGATPGTTRALNYFRIKALVPNPEGSAPRPEEFYFVDFPGYGFASVAPAERDAWRKLLDRYLNRVEDLAGIVMVIDARHGATDLDAQAAEWFSGKGIRTVVAATKADKLKRSEHRAALERARVFSLSFPGCLGCVLVEGEGKAGVPELAVMLDRLVE